MDLRPIWTVNPHFRSAVSVQYSPNGQFIAVACKLSH